MKHALLLFLSFACYPSIAQSLQLREDGFYFYDNNVDTLYLLKGDPMNEARLKADLIKNNVKLTGKSDCVPHNGIPLAGSSDIHLLGFFNKGNGTYISTNCWMETNYKDYLGILERRSKGVNLSSLDKQRSFSVHYLPPNKFSVKFGTNEHNTIMLEGQIFKDELIIIQRYPTFPGGFTPPPDPPKTFKFYPTGTLPPFRDKFVIQYKNPF